MHKHVTPENMLLVLYFMHRFQRRSNEIPTRKQLYKFRSWQEFLRSIANLEELVKIDLEVSVSIASLTELLSSDAPRCVLFLYFDFIDRKYTAEKHLDRVLLAWYPHLRDYSDNAKFKSTLMKQVDPTDTHCFQLFHHLDAQNKKIFCEKLCHYYSDIYT